jgi:tripartite-type tricarboxylate transporter receptor subunit TctC
LPPEIVSKLSDALQKILNKPEIRARMLASFIEPTPSDPATFKSMVRKQLDVWGEKVKVAGVQPE